MRRPCPRRVACRFRGSSYPRPSASQSNSRSSIPARARTKAAVSSSFSGHERAYMNIHIRGYSVQDHGLLAKAEIVIVVIGATVFAMQHINRRVDEIKEGVVYARWKARRVSLWPLPLSFLSRALTAFCARAGKRRLPPSVLCCRVCMLSAGAQAREDCRRLERCASGDEHCRPLFHVRAHAASPCIHRVRCTGYASLECTGKLYR